MMLILVIREGQGCTIGDARVVITKITGPKVRLGIEAPPEIQIHRDNAKNKEPQHTHANRRLRPTATDAIGSVEGENSCGRKAPRSSR